ncbi:MAG TPA: hypothetical protein VFA10_14355 [Ktedonobacteraceae bacterium]|nr:hypothetical protein [Ktedonobacteraceae bacterium]
MATEAEAQMGRISEKIMNTALKTRKLQSRPTQEIRALPTAPMLSSEPTVTMPTEVH